MFSFFSCVLFLSLVLGLTIGSVLLALSNPFSASEGTALCNIGRTNKQGIIGHDGGYSVVLRDGRRLWALGDTWLGEIKHHRREIRGHLANTGAVQPASDICAPLRYLTDSSGNPRELIPALPDDHSKNIAHWPLAMVSDGAQIYLYYQRIRRHSGAGLKKLATQINFEVLGIGVALASVDDLHFHLANNGELLFDAAEHGFSDAIYLEGDMLYGLGCAPEHRKLRRACRLARVPLRQIAERGAYEVWNGTGWNADLKSAAVLFDSGSSEMTLNWDGDRFLVTYIPPFSCDVEIRTSSRLVGPWSHPHKVMRISIPKHAFCYGAKLQELCQDGSSAVLTWNSNGPLSLQVRNPDLYWPHAVRVSIPKRTCGWPPAKCRNALCRLKDLNAVANKIGKPRPGISL